MTDDDQIAAASLRAALAAAGGSQSELARTCGCTYGAIWQMLNKPKPRLSVPYVLRVEAAYNIPRHMLRPDVYPNPVSTVAAAAAA